MHQGLVAKTFMRRGKEERKMILIVVTDEQPLAHSQEAIEDSEV
jgi:uncharacterized protein with von Willebrand factor type A (vWA) domain